MKKIYLTALLTVLLCSCGGGKSNTLYEVNEVTSETPDDAYVIFNGDTITVGEMRSRQLGENSKSTHVTSYENLTGKAKMLQGSWSEDIGTMTFDFENDTEGVWTSEIHQVMSNDYLDMKIVAKIKLDGDEIRMTKVTDVDVKATIDGVETNEEYNKMAIEHMLKEGNTPEYRSKHYYTIVKLTDKELIMIYAPNPDQQVVLYKK